MIAIGILLAFIFAMLGIWSLWQGIKSDVGHLGFMLAAAGGAYFFLALLCLYTVFT